MRLVVLCNILGLSAALVGLASFGLGWFAAAAIWALSGPVGAGLALLLAVAQQSGTGHLPATDCMAVDVGPSRRAA